MFILWLISSEFYPFNMCIYVEKCAYHILTCMVYTFLWTHCCDVPWWIAMFFIMTIVDSVKYGNHGNTVTIYICQLSSNRVLFVKYRGNKILSFVLTLRILLKLLCHLFHAFITRGATFPYSKTSFTAYTCAYARFLQSVYTNYVYIQLNCLFIIVSYMTHFGVT